MTKGKSYFWVGLLIGVILTSFTYSYLGREEALRAVTIKIRSDAIPDITVIGDLPDLQWSLTFR